jgi:hypothetical protein
MEYTRSLITKYLLTDSKSMDEIVARLDAVAEEARAMGAAGVKVDTVHYLGENPVLITEDPLIAERFGFDPPDPDDYDDEEAEVCNQEDPEHLTGADDESMVGKG